MGIQISVKVNGETERDLVEWLRAHLGMATSALEALGRMMIAEGGPEAFAARVMGGLHEAQDDSAARPPLSPGVVSLSPADQFSILVEPLKRIAYSPHPGRALLHALRSPQVYAAIAATGGFPAAMVLVFGESLPSDITERFRVQLDAAMLAEAEIPRLERERDTAEKALAWTEVEEQARPNPPGADLARLKEQVDRLALASVALAGARARAADRPPGIPEDTAAWARAVIAQASISAQLPPEIIGEEV